MKRLLVGASLLLILTTAFAIPSSNFNWTYPTNYEDGTVIDATVDTVTYSLYCSKDTTGPYNLVSANLPSSPQNVDVSTCVGGVPGTYYFVMTAVSTFYNTESDYSNEIARLYSASELGKTPNAPILLSVN